ncbi:MAG: cell division protein ZapA [bacterium]|nr:cell division protein ZapA [bacterium]
MNSPLSPKKRIQISLLGQRFTVRSDKSEEYMEALSKYVAQQLDQISKQTHSASTQHVALLTSLNLADQLLQKEDELHKLKHELKDRTQNALKEVDDALAMLPHHHIEIVAPISDSENPQPAE